MAVLAMGVAGGGGGGEEGRRRSERVVQTALNEIKYRRGCYPFHVSRSRDIPVTVYV